MSNYQPSQKFNKIIFNDKMRDKLKFFFARSAEFIEII